MQSTKTTMEVVALLGVKHYLVRDALRTGKLAPPPKNSSGDFLWGSEHIAAPRKALASRRRKAVPA
jgi:hypothetical protein